MKDKPGYFAPFRRYDNLGVVLTLYDFFGYLILGFFFVFGIIAIKYFSGAQNATCFFNNILGTWWGIVFLLIVSYMAGHFLSGVTKILERIPGYQRYFKLEWVKKGFSESLFLGPPDTFLAVHRGISPVVLNRFCYKYLTLVVGREDIENINTSFSVLKRMVTNKELRWSDIIWDSASYLLNYAPPYYNLQYGFLVLAGLFRATCLASFLLLAVYIANLLHYPPAITPDISPWITAKDIMVFTVLGLSCILSFNRYLKFGRMHNYQIIRSFALLRLPETRADAHND